MVGQTNGLRSPACREFPMSHPQLRNIIMHNRILRNLLSHWKLNPEHISKPAFSSWHQIIAWASLSRIPLVPGPTLHVEGTNNILMKVRRIKGKLAILHMMILLFSQIIWWIIRLKILKTVTIQKYY